MNAPSRVEATPTKRVPKRRGLRVIPGAAGDPRRAGLLTRLWNRFKGRDDEGPGSRVVDPTDIYLA